jgi:hypothetical protein
MQTNAFPLQARKKRLLRAADIIETIQELKGARLSAARDGLHHLRVQATVDNESLSAIPKRPPTGDATARPMEQSGNRSGEF